MNLVESIVLATATAAMIRTISGTVIIRTVIRNTRRQDIKRVLRLITELIRAIDGR
jgi:hypothetical protein